MRVFALFATACLLQQASACEISRDEFNRLARKTESLALRTESLENGMVALEKENRELKQMRVTQDRVRGDRFVLDTMESPVAFTAAIKPGFVDHMNPKQTIVFETTITDIGGGYNNASGVFIAPWPGTYVFACSLLDHNYNGLTVHAEIVKNNASVLGRVFAHAEQHNYRDQGAQTVVTHLNAGEQVWVRLWDSHDLSLGGQLYSTFTGFLLYGD